MATTLDHCRRRRTHAAVLAAFLTATWTTAMCMAEPISVAGSQGFGDVGSTAAVSTNDVNTATSFDFGNFLSTGVSDGYFAGLPTQLFGTVSFSIADPLSLSFGNATFGQFDSTSIMELSNDPLAGSRSFMIRGTYTAGSFQALSPSTVPADFTVSFNQVITGATISSNSTLAIQAVPEPGTLGLAAAAIVAAAFVHRRRRE